MEENKNALQEILSRLAFDKADQFILTRDKEGYHSVFLADIIYCESFNSYITFHLENARNITSSNFSMKKCAQILHVEKGFFRVHNKYLVNLLKIECYKPGKDGGTIYMKNGEKIKVARQRKGRFLDAFYALSINTRLQNSS